MDKVEIGKKYYFNNREVIVIRMENEQFAFVVGNLNIDHDITGSEFCHECLVGSCDGSYHSHTCDDAQNIIDNLMEELGDKEVFWVDIRYLHNHPFEYKKHVKLLNEIKKLEEIKGDLISDHEKIKNEISASEIEDKRLIESVRNNIRLIAESDKQIEKIKEIKNEVKLNLDNSVKVNDMDIKITIQELKSLYKNKITLRLLEEGGVDNWEWYGESIGEADIEALATQEIITTQIDRQ